MKRRGTSSSVWAKQITRLQTAPAPDRFVLVTGLCNLTNQPSSQLHPLTLTQLLARRARRGLSDTPIHIAQTGDKLQTLGVSSRGLAGQLTDVLQQATILSSPPASTQ